MRFFLVSIFLFSLFANSNAQELFVGYLKPYSKKSDFKKVFKRRDPTEEPYKFNKILEKFKLKQDEEGISKDIELKAILYNPVHKKAYINDILVKEGDVIKDDIIVKEIKENYIKIEKNKKIYTLKIEEGDRE